MAYGLKWTINGKWENQIVKHFGFKEFDHIRLIDFIKMS